MLHEILGGPPLRITKLLAKVQNLTNRSTEIRHISISVVMAIILQMKIIKAMMMMI